MRVATVDGLVTLFYDGSKELINRELQSECFRLYLHRRRDIKNWEELNLSNEVKEYWRERQSWQQVIVVEGVTEIPEWTFSHCFNIQKVIFANTVLRIESNAFFRCYSLVYIKVSIILEFIGDTSFHVCNLSSVFLPPRCRVEGSAFAGNANLKIVNVPQDVELQECVFAGTKLIADSPFGNEKGYYDDADEEAVQEWIKNINSHERFSLHRACCSFQPDKEVIMTIVLQQGIGAFSVENQMCITPSQYLKANPYTDISEKDIIEAYIMKMMG